MYRCAKIKRGNMSPRLNKTRKPVLAPYISLRRNNSDTKMWQPQFAIMTRSKPPNERSKRLSQAPVVNFCMTNIARQLEEMKANSKDGRVPYGAVTRLVNENKQYISWLTKDYVNNYIKRLKKKQE